MVSQKEVCVSLQIIVSKIPIFKLTTGHDNPSMGRALTSSKHKIGYEDSSQKVTMSVSWLFPLCPSMTLSVECLVCYENQKFVIKF